MASFVINEAGSNRFTFPQTIRNGDSLTFFHTGNGRVGSIIEWIVPRSGDYRIVGTGARGGNSGSNRGGLGAEVTGYFYLVKGEKVLLVVGQVGETIGRFNTGGGGGTFVWREGDDLPLIAAGGGGGASSTFAGRNTERTPQGSQGVGSDTTNRVGAAGVDGSGGNVGAAGWFSDGTGAFNAGGGSSPRNGAEGGVSGTLITGFGGFGGGGGGTGQESTSYGAGGGGGYSGGASQWGDHSAGGAGGSFFLSNRGAISPAVNDRNGFVFVYAESLSSEEEKTANYKRTKDVIIEKGMTPNEAILFNATSSGKEGSIMEWEILQSGTYEIEASGAQGGSHTHHKGGLGARIKTEVSLLKGDVLQVLVGHQGQGGPNYNRGGGGGSFVWKKGESIPLAIAGGGGGASININGVGGTTSINGTDGSSRYYTNVRRAGTYGAGASIGGAGWFSNGGTANGGEGGYSPLSGGRGGAPTNSFNGEGGFGGGSSGAGTISGTIGAGGGGGYSGGGGQRRSLASGGGGGSFWPVSAKEARAGVHFGDGVVRLKLLRLEDKNLHIANRPGKGEYIFPPVLRGNDSIVIRNSSKEEAGSICRWTAPTDGQYRITAIGASGGDEKNSCGRAAVMSGVFEIAKDDHIDILVGQRGTMFLPLGPSGGGGGTFVFDSSGNPLIVAGGGGGRYISRYTGLHSRSNANTHTGGKSSYPNIFGGVNGEGGMAGTSSGGGGGILSNGINGSNSPGGQAYTSGALGGVSSRNKGGYGGGGSGFSGGGGGGGYSGGSGGRIASYYGQGGGGGSFNSGDLKQASIHNEIDHGKVIIEPVNVEEVYIKGITFSSAYVFQEDKTLEMSIEIDPGVPDMEGEIHSLSIQVGNLFFEEDVVVPGVAKIQFSTETFPIGETPVKVSSRSMRKSFDYSIVKEDKNSYTLRRRFEHDLSFEFDDGVILVPGIGYSYTGSGKKYGMIKLDTIGKSTIGSISSKADDDYGGEDHKNFHANEIEWTIDSYESRTPVDLDAFSSIKKLRTRRQ